MNDQRLYLIQPESPRSERRRRQRQQQSSCCSCLLVVVSLVVGLMALWGPLGKWWSGRQSSDARRGPAAMFPLEIQTDSPSYYRYELVRMDLQIVNRDGRPVKMAKAPFIVVRCDGEIVTTVGGTRKLRPYYDAKSGLYRCWWPVPWRAEAGSYVAEAKMALEQPDQWPWEVSQGKDKARADERKPIIEGTAYCIAQAEFEIKNRPPSQLAPGLCAVTWEPHFPLQRVRRPDGSMGDWRAMLDWCEFMGADCLWFRGAVTDARMGALSLQQPFTTHNLDEISRLADAAHRRGLKFGVWAAAHVTYRSRTDNNRPAYEYARDISRSTGRITQTDFISLLDPLRVQHLTDFFKRMQNTAKVDFIGLDYLRSEYGYEMVDQFADEMPVSLPDGWENLTQKQRWLYVAKIVEKGRKSRPELDFYEHWNWWRAHRTAEIVHEIISEGNITKPVWIFVLSWIHGAQHGQDPAMFTDAGVGLIAPMLYQMPSQEHFEETVKSWQEYMRPDVANVAAGDQVDDRWHQRSRRPAAPELLYQRMMAAHHKFIGKGRTVGAFWHDVSRAAVRGTLGPYPGTEWALAGAATFSQIRQSWSLYPLNVEMTAPTTAAIGSSFRVDINIENLTDTNVRNIEISLEDTPQITAVGDAKKTVDKLGPSESHKMPISVRIAKANGERANRFMVALRIRWPAADYGGTVDPDLPRTIVVMKYVQGT